VTIWVAAYACTAHYLLFCIYIYSYRACICVIPRPNNYTVTTTKRQSTIALSYKLQSCVRITKLSEEVDNQYFGCICPSIPTRWSKLSQRYDGCS